MRMGLPVSITGSGILIKSGADAWKLSGAAGGVTGFNGRAGPVTFEATDLPLVPGVSGGYVNASITVDIYGRIIHAEEGPIRPPSMADSEAALNTVYYSTTASKLVYKDSLGTVNNLY